MAENSKKVSYQDLTLEAVEEYNKGDYESALPKFQEMARVNPENLKVHELLAYIYIKYGELEKAQEEFSILRDLLKQEMPDLSEPKTFDELVDEAGDIKKIEKQFKKIMRKKAPKNSQEIIDFNIPSKLSILYMAQGEFEKAEEVLTKFKKKFVS